MLWWRRKEGGGGDKIDLHPIQGREATPQVTLAK